MCRRALRVPHHRTQGALAPSDFGVPGGGALESTPLDTEGHWSHQGLALCRGLSQTLEKQGNNAAPITAAGPGTSHLTAQETAVDVHRFRRLSPRLGGDLFKITDSQDSWDFSQQKCENSVPVKFIRHFRMI